MKRGVLVAVAAALLAGLLSGVALAHWSGIAGTVTGVVVPTISEELKEKGFEIAGFTVDLGRVPAESYRNVKGIFTVKAPYKTVLLLRVSTEGPITSYKINVYDGSGNHVGTLTPYDKYIKLEVKEGSNTFTVYIDIYTGKVDKETPFKLVLELEEA